MYLFINVQKYFKDLYFFIFIYKKMIVKYYIQHTLLTAFNKRNIFIFLMIIIIQVLIQIYFLMNLFGIEKKKLDAAILAFSTDYYSPLRLFLDSPRAVIFDNNSQFNNLGIKYYSDIKSFRNLSHLQFYSANQSKVDEAFKNDFNIVLNNTEYNFTKFNYYNCTSNNDFIENKITYYSTIMNFDNYDKIDLNYLPIESYGDSLPFLYNEMLANKIFNNSKTQYQVFNYVKGVQIEDSANVMRILSSNFTYVSKILKKIFDFSLYKLSFIFIDILFTERKNNTFDILEIYNFSKFFHFVGNLIPFFIVVSINSLIIVCLYYFWLKNTSLIYIYFMLITIQFCQYLYFYTLVSMVKKKNFLKMKVISYTIFLINLLLSKTDDFSYSYLLFPPFFMRVLNNYFYESMLYYSQIEENYIFEMTVFILTWVLFLTIFLMYFNKIKNICDKKNKLNYIDTDQSNKLNIQVYCKNKNRNTNKIYDEKTSIIINENKINFITGDNNSGKTKILKQITNKLPRNQIFYYFTKKKGIFYNLTIQENLEFFKLLMGENSKKNSSKNSGQFLTNILSNEPRDNLEKNTSFLLQNFEKVIDLNNKINENTKNIHLYKLYLLLTLLNESNSNKKFKFLVLDQPFNKLDKSESSELLEYLSIFEGTIIISSNYKPDTDSNNFEVVLETKNLNYPNNFENFNTTDLNYCINNDKNFLVNKSNINTKIKIPNNYNSKNKKLVKETLLNISIFTIIFLFSCSSIYFFPVNIDDAAIVEDNKYGYDKISSKIIDEPMTNVYLTDNINRNSTFFECLNKKVNFLNATENREYLDHYFNKSVIFKEHAVEILIENTPFQDKMYVNMMIKSRPIDIFRNIQLSALFSDCFVNDPSYKLKFKTSIEIRHIDNNHHFNRTIILDVQLFLITILYFLFLIRILDFNKNYFMDTFKFSGLILILISIEYYLADIPFNKCLFIPKLLLYSLCCNLKNYNIKKFLIGIIVANLGCLIIYFYYAIIYLLFYFWNVETKNHFILYWVTIILESFSPYNRILFYKPVAFTFMMVFSAKEKIAYNILEGYKIFYSEKQQNKTLWIWLCVLGSTFWLIIYFYLIIKKKPKTKNPSKDFELKRSSEYFMFQKDNKVKNIIDTNSDVCVSLCLDKIKNKCYSDLSYTMRNKVLLTYIGWEHLDNQNNSSNFKMLNKEQVEINLDLHTKDSVKNNQEIM
jgi:hypothetical protein